MPASFMVSTNLQLEFKICGAVFGADGALPGKLRELRAA